MKLEKEHQKISKAMNVQLAGSCRGSMVEVVADAMRSFLPVLKGKNHQNLSDLM